MEQKRGKTVVMAYIPGGNQPVDNPVETVDNSCRNGRDIQYYVSLSKGKKGKII